ncbi:hypothetical protein [Bacillus toyonensis]|uniref:hypothetical protein n=1 Tax=Bacillus toyonensis TaxID=155322 RepID=UPI00259D7F50|nr:hypothetical protein [Bacillus toyonensis]MDM5254300.1 hypothetical protein [Bacillus toyonensis]
MEDSTISLFSLGVSALGVLVTGVFSCLIWRANKNAANAAQSAANAAKDSAALAKSALDYQIHLDEKNKQKEAHKTIIVRGEVTANVLGTFNQLVNLPNEKDLVEAVKNLPSTLPLSENWSSHFSVEECAAISNAKQNLEEFNRKYVPNGIPTINPIPQFLGDSRKLLLQFQDTSHVLVTLGKEKK